MGGNLYTVTAADYASWPKPNYIDPFQHTWLAPYAIVWCILSTIPVAARLYLRILKKSGTLGLDDAFILVAWIFSVVFTIVCCVTVWQDQLGRHIWDVDPSKYSPVLYYAWLAEIFFILSTGAMKLSILCFYHRLIREEHGRVWKYTTWVLMFITGGVCIAFFFSYAFMCSPMSAYWDIHKLLAANADYTCIDGRALTISSGTLSIASDFWCAALPCAMFQVHDLGVTRRQKIALNTIFSFGFLVTAIGIVRTYYLYQLLYHQDLSWIGYKLLATAVTECQLAILCTCAPFLRAFFRRYPPRVATRSTISGLSAGRSRIVSSVYARRRENALEPNHGDQRSLREPSFSADTLDKRHLSFELQPVQEEDSEKGSHSYHADRAYNGIDQHLNS